MAATSSPVERETNKPARIEVSSRFRLRPRTVAIYLVLTVLAIIFLIPFYLVLRNAFMSTTQITSFGWYWVPAPVQWDNFQTLFNDPTAPMLGGLKNSAIIATVTLVLSMLFSSMAGYALARIPYRGRNLVFFAIIATLMIPQQAIFVPTFVVVVALGGLNTLWGIIAPGLFSAFATFLFRQSYLQFPREIEEAGRVDGLGYFGIYWYLLLPNSVAILMALGVLGFIGSWNAFLWPLVIGQDPSSWTVQVVLSTFLTSQTINLPELFAGAAVGIAPLVIVFLMMQHYIVEGVTLSGVKG